VDLDREAQVVNMAPRDVDATRTDAIRKKERERRHIIEDNVNPLTQEMNLEGRERGKNGVFREAAARMPKGETEALSVTRSGLILKVRVQEEVGVATKM
jgi:hypothetical protein